MTNIKSKKFNGFTPLLYLPLVISIILFFICISLITSNTGYEKYLARVYQTAGWFFLLVGAISVLVNYKMPEISTFKIVIGEYLMLIFLIVITIMVAPRGFGVIKYYDKQISNTEKISYFWADKDIFKSNLGNFFSYGHSWEFEKEMREYRNIYIGDRRNPTMGYKCLSDVVNHSGSFLTHHRYDIPNDRVQALEYMQQKCYLIPSDQLELMKIAKNGGVFPILE